MTLKPSILYEVRKETRKLHFAKEINYTRRHSILDSKNQQTFIEEILWTYLLITCLLMLTNKWILDNIFVVTPSLRYLHSTQAPGSGLLDTLKINFFLVHGHKNRVLLFLLNAQSSF